LTPPEEKQNIDALSALLELKGLDASDFIDVINALSNIKKREQTKIEKEEAEAEKPKENKIYQNKRFLYETRQDVFIYQDGRTKSGKWYIRIYDDKTKKVFSKSLRTTNEIEAAAQAQKIFEENKERMRKGVKLVSLTTKDLIDYYLKWRFQQRTTIPHAGITYTSYDNLIKKLKYWEEYIKEKKHKNTKLEDLPTELGLGFAQWILEKPKTSYSNNRYKDKPRSRQTVNQIVAAVKKMYKDVAINRKFITMNEMPIFEYLKVQKDSAPKRDVLTEEEYGAIRKWMQYKWVNEKGIKPDEKLKRRLYGLFFTIHHQTGQRSKEILGLKWGDISINPADTPEKKRFNRVIHIRKENAKTGVSRNIIAPVAEQFNRIKEIYKQVGVEVSNEDFVFQHISKTRRGTNCVWGQPLIEKRLKAVCSGAAEAGVWKPEGRNITNYSARHYYATQAIMRKVDIYDIALNMGTSIQYLQSTYIHATTLMKSDDLTKGQGIYKVMEERKQKEAAAEKAIRDALTESDAFIQNGSIEGLDKPIQ
jgi:integrase